MKSENESNDRNLYLLRFLIAAAMILLAAATPHPSAPMELHAGRRDGHLFRLALPQSLGSLSIPAGRAFRR